METKIFCGGNLDTKMCDICSKNPQAIKFPTMGGTLLICEKCAINVTDARGNKPDLNNRIKDGGNMIISTNILIRKEKISNENYKQICVDLDTGKTVSEQILPLSEIKHGAGGNGSNIRPNKYSIYQNRLCNYKTHKKKGGHK